MRFDVDVGPPRVAVIAAFAGGVPAGDEGRMAAKTWVISAQNRWLVAYTRRGSSAAMRTLTASRAAASCPCRGA
jgi:hypothetical protein